MIWKKSSSIVRWIFYISIIELVFWIILNALPFFIDSYQEKLGDFEDGLTLPFIIITTIFTFGIILIFIYFLYKAYRNISAVDNIKSLMESILKTRKIVKYYVGYNLLMAILMTIYSIFSLFTQDDRTIALFDNIKEQGSELRFWLVATFFAVLALICIVGFVWLLYQLIYGFLLKKLNQNYKELKRLEV